MGSGISKKRGRSAHNFETPLNKYLHLIYQFFIISSLLSFIMQSWKKDKQTKGGTMENKKTKSGPRHRLLNWAICITFFVALWVHWAHMHGGIAHIAKSYIAYCTDSDGMPSFLTLMRNCTFWFY